MVTEVVAGPVIIDQSLDRWVWISAVLFLLVLGIRAWVLETGRRQLGGTPARVRGLTVASGVVLSVVLVLFMTQAGTLLVRSLVTGTNPLSLMGGTDEQPVPNGPDDQTGQGDQAGQPAPHDGQAPHNGGAPAAPAGG